MLKKIKSRLYSASLALGKIKYCSRCSKVLYYHDVHHDSIKPDTIMSTPISLFSHHIETIKSEGFDLVDEITDPNNQILITFDDGFAGVYKNKDFFMEQSLNPTVFLISDRIGTNNFMNAEEIRHLQTEGFKFQSHSHTHPDLNKLNAQQLEFEFLTSKAILEKLTSKEVNQICFPKGLFNTQVLEVAKKCGYSSFFSSIPGGYFENYVNGVIQRNLVQDSNRGDFLSILYGGSGIFKRRYLNQHFNI